MKDRPNPDEVLHRIKEDEKKEAQGKLKIFLGAAPGVGKTYAMLEEALERRDKDFDVVIGIAESHGRKEIENFIKKFDVLPRQTVDYHGRKLTEFDLDAAIKRNPGLIIIDELAHTNVPGLRHDKRWKDIKEILERGIDVYTTLNVQHIESLNNVVAQIIGTTVKETVPDSLLELADSIEIVDLPPEDLLKRLQEGKVYFPRQADIAKENFFRKGNLIALRELALRTIADRVGIQTFLYRQDLGIREVWPTKDKILVCVGPSSESIKLIRDARRLAFHLQAEWIAVYVDRPAVKKAREEFNYAIQNLRLAQQLGAETKIITGFDIVNEIMNFARHENITKIIVGKKIRSRLRDLFSRHLADEIVRESGNIDVYIVTTQEKDIQPVETVSQVKKIPWKIYGFAVALVVLATIINYLVSPYLHASNLIMIYLLAITAVALFGETGPSLFASILGVLAYDFFFIPPISSFGVTDLEYLITLIVMLIVSQIISYLTLLNKQQTTTAKHAEQQTSSLLRLSRQLASLRGVDRLLQTGVWFMADLFDAQVIGLLPVDEELCIKAKSDPNETTTSKEEAVIKWVYELGQIAGAGTETLSFLKALYLPLQGFKEAVGVLRIIPKDPSRLFTDEEMNLLQACAHQIAISINVDQLQSEKASVELKSEKKRTRINLLKNLSKDLRIPLSKITSDANTLMGLGEELNNKNIMSISTTIQNQSEELNRLIDNVSQITNLETGEVQLKKELCDINDIIKLAIDKLSLKLGTKPIHLHLTEMLPVVEIDKMLIREVVINFVDNAIKYTAYETAIDIFSLLKGEEIQVRVEDQGPGVISEEVGELFKKYSTSRLLSDRSGLGLGLAICKKIIIAHRGKIWAENREGGGAVFYFTIPTKNV